MLSESCSGLLLGSLLERGARVTNFFQGSAPTLPECYSEWRELDQRVYNLPLAQIVPLATAGHVVTHFNADQQPARVDDAEDATEVTDEPEPIHGQRRKRGAFVAGTEQRNKRPKLEPELIQAKRDERDRRRDEAVKFLLAGPHDSLVVAIKLHPCELVLRMLSFLGDGRPFVVYSQFLQPLVELYDALRKRTASCSLNITESWLRNYQVLPDRTHPEMAMSGTGGYLLTGIKLQRS